VLRQFRLLSLCAGLAFACLDTAFAAFDPKAADVCTPTKTGPVRLIVDRKLLLGQLLEKSSGITAIDLNKSGDGVTPDQQAAALLNPDDCKTCGDKVADKLRAAQTNLNQFLYRHAGPGDPSKDNIDTSNFNTKNVRDIEEARRTAEAVRAFLFGLPQAEPPVCRLAKTDADPGTNAAKSGSPKGGKSGDGSNKDGKDGGGSNNDQAPQVLPGYFSLRQTVEDLPIPQSDSRFKGAKQASISLTDDKIAHKNSYTVDLAAGYTIGRSSFDEAGHVVGQVTPFFTYNQQTVRTSDPKKNVYANNLGFGVMGDVTFPTGWGGYQNVNFYPKYVTSERNGAEVFSGTFVYTPMYGIPGIDSVLYIVPQALSFVFTPQLKEGVNDVVNAGGDITLLQKGSYYWIGPKLNLTVFGEGVLEGFGYYATYEVYKVESGNIAHVENFQTAITYDFGKTKLMSVQLKYQKGRNLDTLERLDQLTLGLGVKY
jgi:hypothetical protein